MCVCVCVCLQCSRELSLQNWDLFTPGIREDFPKVTQACIVQFLDSQITYAHFPKAAVPKNTSFIEVSNGLISHILFHNCFSPTSDIKPTIHQF